MKSDEKVCAMLCLLLGASVLSPRATQLRTLAEHCRQYHRFHNDAVAGINPGTTPWSAVGGRARVNLATGRVSFAVDGLVLNGGNATGTPGGVTSGGLVICDAGQQDQNHLTTPPVPLDARGNADFSGDIPYHSGHLHKPPSF